MFKVHKVVARPREAAVCRTSDQSKTIEMIQATWSLTYVNSWNMMQLVMIAITTMLVLVIMMMVMVLHRATLEKIVEYTEHNIKVLSKVEPGMTLT